MTLLALTPSKLTDEPLLKPTPAIVMTAPTGAFLGEKDDTDSVGVNLALLVPVFTGVVIAIVPAPAPLGTVASICVEECSVNVAASPSSFTAVAPVNAVPVIVTELPVIPLFGVKPVIVGAFEITLAVCVETAGELEPEALLAIS